MPAVISQYRGSARPTLGTAGRSHRHADLSSDAKSWRPDSVRAAFGLRFPSLYLGGFLTKRRGQRAFAMRRSTANERARCAVSTPRSCNFDADGLGETLRVAGTSVYAGGDLLVREQGPPRPCRKRSDGWTGVPPRSIPDAGPGGRKYLHDVSAIRSSGTTTSTSAANFHLLWGSRVTGFAKVSPRTARFDPNSNPNATGAIFPASTRSSSRVQTLRRAATSPRIGVQPRIDSRS